MAMNQRMIWAAAIALLVPIFCGSAALAGPLGLIDDFSDTNLSEYTSTVILDNNGGASNTITWQSPAGSLELVTSAYDGIEQYAYIRSGISLLVGEEVQMDLTHTPDSQDLGLYVGGTTPVTGTRQDYVAMYARNGGALYSRGFDGTTEYPLVGGSTPTYDKLFIARIDVNTYEAGWYDAGARNVLVTRTPTTPNDGDVVGFYADVRAVGTLGNADNLTVAPGIIAGDVDGDRDVDMDDFSIIRGNFYNSVTQRSDGDLNLDGIVDFADFREWKDHHPYPGAGAGALTETNIPEPASWTLLSISGVLMLVVRRAVLLET